MDFEFNTRIDKAIQKSVRGAFRQFKEQQNPTEGVGSEQTPPSYESFISSLIEFMAVNKSAELNKLRSPSLKELFERAWAQKLRSYSTLVQFREAYEKLLRRYSR